MPEEDVEYIKGLLATINPQLSKKMGYFTHEEIRAFEKQRKVIQYERHEERLIDGFFIKSKITQKVSTMIFFEAFGNKLTFGVSDKFDVKKIDKVALIKNKKNVTMKRHNILSLTM
ncbi:hypothetical protein BIY23_01500 [Wolbachia pipientis]|uniref:Uncharacterized protein n=1 Tax=Wolbachia pipientis TaxID=955 RepID=A0A1E7QKY4_WOLPI|nr:hypothetical protein [Wolbachia pipientis]OEY87138.1 hypothetical protein BIY23_01500 [Wolbachia pipientis]